MKVSVYSFLYMCVLVAAFTIGACSSKRHEDKKAVVEKPRGTHAVTHALPSVSQKSITPAANWSAVKMRAKAADINAVQADVHERAQAVHLAQLSSNDLSQQVLAAIEGRDMVVIKRLWEHLRAGGNYDMALHLATNALVIVTSPADKACAATMTLEVSVGSLYNGDEDQAVAEHALNVLRDVTPDLSPEERELRWSIASVAYCSMCSAVFKDIDKALRAIEFVDAYIENENRASFQRDSVYRNIASQLVYAKDVASIRMSKSSAESLRAYADTLDETYIPACVKSLPNCYDVGERKLKLLITRGVARYQNERTNVPVRTQQ